MRCLLDTGVLMLTFNTNDFRRYRGITALTPKEFLQRAAVP